MNGKAWLPEKVPKKGIENVMPAFKRKETAKPDDGFAVSYF